MADEEGGRKQNSESDRVRYAETNGTGGLKHIRSAAEKWKLRSRDREDNEGEDPKTRNLLLNRFFVLTDDNLPPIWEVSMCRSFDGGTIR